MAITYKSAGAGVSSETSAVSLSPACPATVDANDILIAHVFWEGTSGSPSAPSGWTLLDGPRNIETTVAQHWVYGKIADGTEDGLAITFALAPLVTTQRAARIYSFAGYVSGTITEVVRGFSATSHATDPQMPTVTTTQANSLAVALVAQNDNNAFASPTGETGGDWVEAVAEYTAALTPGLSLGLETAAMASAGTISGGSMATTNDPCGVIGFEIRAQGITNYTLAVDSGSFILTGTASNLEYNRKIVAESASYVLTGTAASLEKGYKVIADSGTFALSGTAATFRRTYIFNSEAGSFAVTGIDATLRKGINFSVDPGSFAVIGTAATLLRTYIFSADPGSFVLTGTAALFERIRRMIAESGSFTLTGTSARATLDVFPERSGGVAEEIVQGGGGVRFISIEEIEHKKAKNNLERFLNKRFTDSDFNKLLNSIIDKFNSNQEFIDPFLTEDEEALLFIIIALGQSN